MTKTPITVSTYLKQQLALTDKPQKQIAKEVGFNQPNNISMIKEGITKLPVNRVPAFAKALGVDPIHLLRLAMREYMPETWNVIEALLGQSLVTENEKELLKMIRKASRNIDIDFTEDKNEQAIMKALESIVEREMRDREGASKAANKPRKTARAT